jgi:hypothetical protein
VYCSTRTENGGRTCSSFSGGDESAHRFRRNSSPEQFCRRRTSACWPVSAGRRRRPARSRHRSDQAGIEQHPDVHRAGHVLVRQPVFCLDGRSLQYVIRDPRRKPGKRVCSSSTCVRANGSRHDEHTVRTAPRNRRHVRPEEHRMVSARIRPGTTSRWSMCRRGRSSWRANGGCCRVRGGASRTKRPSQRDRAWSHRSMRRGRLRANAICYRGAIAFDHNLLWLVDEGGHRVCGSRSETRPNFTSWADATQALRVTDAISRDRTQAFHETHVLLGHCGTEFGSAAADVRSHTMTASLSGR